MDKQFEDEVSFLNLPDETLFVEQIFSRFYTGNQENMQNLTPNQMVTVVQKELEGSKDSAILTLKNKANSRDPHAVNSLLKMISDTIADLGISTQMQSDNEEIEESSETQEELENRAHEEAVLYVFSQLYGFKNRELEHLYREAEKRGIEEIYVNRRDDIRYKIRGEKCKAKEITWDSELDVVEVLNRLTLNHPDGQAGKNNPVGRIMLADGTRLAFTAGDASKTSFNLRFDRSNLLTKNDFIPNVMSEDVYYIVLALTSIRAACGIIGKGAVGKTALLRQMLYELVRIQPMIRLFIMELMAELKLEDFLLAMGLDPDIVECVATKENSLEDLFENMKQRAADIIIQGEILSASEVANLLTGYKAGHPMGLFTAHSDGKRLPRYLAELLAQEKHVDLEATEKQVLNVLDASVVLKEKVAGQPRKLVEIWQYPDEPKYLVKFDRRTNKYIFYPAEGELREKFEALSYDEETRFLYDRLCQLGIIGGVLENAS